MKKLTILFATLFSVYFLSCKKDSTETTTSAATTPPAAVFKCTFNGVAVNFPNPNVTVSVGHTIAAGDSLHAVIFNLMQNANPGSYYIHPWVGSVHSAYGYYFFTAIDSGNVTITDTTGHKIKGTFYFRSGTNIGKDGTFENVPLP